MSAETLQQADYRAAARVFAKAYNQLTPGERAQLRRDDAPSRLAAFWRCFNPAKRLAPKLSVPLCERLIPLLPFLAQEQEEGAVTNVGCLLRKNKGAVNLRRVEALLSARNLDELMDELMSVAGLLKGETVDYGQLYMDLRFFDDDPVRVMRRWARAFFEESTESDKGECHV